MVGNAVDRAIDQLSGSNVVVNAQPIGQGGEYIMPARTAQELVETQIVEYEPEEVTEIVEETKVEPTSNGEVSWLL